MIPDRQTEFGALLLTAGLPETAAVLAGPPTADAPAPPEGVWVVIPYGEEYVIGGMGRGRFATYGTADDLEAAVAVVRRLVLTPPRAVPADEVDALERRAEATARGIERRVGGRAGAPGPAMVAAGEALDTFGAETTHHLYAAGTPFAQRSQPPDDVDAPYHRYLVLSPLPEASEGIAAPWFGQPGGGAMVVLTKPIRWYVDQGHLVEIEG